MNSEQTAIKTTYFSILANILLAPSAARNRLTSGLFLPIGGESKTKEPLGRLEYAMQSMIDAVGAEKKLQAAIKSPRDS